MMRHVEDPGIVTIYSGIFNIFRNIEQYLAMFRHTEEPKGILSHIQTY